MPCDILKIVNVKCLLLIDENMKILKKCLSVVICVEFNVYILIIRCCIDVCSAKNVGQFLNVMNIRLRGKSRKPAAAENDRGKFVDLDWRRGFFLWFFCDL